jgi:hypothetical protein
MKQRQSFVTNSSSSSFVLAVKDEGFLNSGTSKLEKFVKGIVFGNAEIIKTKEELDNFFKANYIYGAETLEEFLQDEDYERNKYNKWLEYINKGFLIVERTIDNNEETMFELIDNMPDDENIIMLEGGC